MTANAKCLASIGNGKSAFVIGLNAGRRATSRLESLGILPGVELSVLTNNRVGPLLIAVGPGRVMVERGIASKVLVA